MGDHIDGVRSQWAEIFPDIDTAAISVLGRIARIAQVVQVRSDSVLAASGVSRSEFDVLSLLARHGGTLSPTRVSAELIISGAGVTKRVKRLESEALISRIPDPADGRGSLVSLTERGWERLRPILESVLEFEGHLLAGIDADVRNELAPRLRELLHSLEIQTGTD